MKVPLRFQITEFDCGTVSLLNCFSYLFDREEIPAELVKAINKYTLDCYDSLGNIGQGGTSREAIDKLSHWITKYSNTKSNLNIKCECLEDKEISLNKIESCLKNNGVCFIRSWLYDEHYIIATKIKGKYIYIFDPYYLDVTSYKDSQVKIILNKPFTHNRKVTLKRFLSEERKNFSLGPVNGRQCVLINKINL